MTKSTVCHALLVAALAEFIMIVVLVFAAEKFKSEAEKFKGVEDGYISCSHNFHGTAIGKNGDQFITQCFRVVTK